MVNLDFLFNKRGKIIIKKDNGRKEEILKEVETKLWYKAESGKLIVSSNNGSVVEKPRKAIIRVPANIYDHIGDIIDDTRASIYVEVDGRVFKVLSIKDLWDPSGRLHHVRFDV